MVGGQRRGVEEWEMYAPTTPWIISRSDEKRLAMEIPSYVSSTPTTVKTANRLFGQENYQFKAPFLNICKESWNAPLELMDFTKNPDGSRLKINDWVAKQTEQKIDRKKLPKKVQRVLAVAEADGGKVSDFAIDLVLKKRNGELTPQQVQEKIRQHYCGD